MRSGVVFLLFGTLMWGQAGMGKSPSDATKDGQVLASAVSMARGAATIAPDAAIITIDGLCGDAANKKTVPSNCKTVITRAQFEALIEFVQPNMAPADRRKFATGYAETLIRAQQAHEMGLDTGPRFEALMKLRRDLTLQLLLAQSLAEKVKQVSDADVEQYFEDKHKNFEEIELQRLYVPAAQQIPAVGNPEEVQKRKQDSILAMKKTAEELRIRAVAGEDFAQLQAEAYKAALFDTSAAPAKVETRKYRRGDLHFTQEDSVMDLKPGEVSEVFDEPNALYIYKAGAKRTLPLEEVKGEILKKLRAERLQRSQQEVKQYATATLDEKYFAVTSTSSEGEP